MAERSGHGHRRRHNPPRHDVQVPAGLQDQVDESRHKHPPTHSQNQPKGGKGGDGGGGGNAKHKAARSYIEQAETLALQAKALRAALGKHGFREALKQKLDNVRLVTRQGDEVLLSGYQQRVGVLDQASADNDKAAAGQTVANLTNQARERANAMSEIAANGAGESDMLRAQEMSLRNWQQNQSEVNRSYFDTLSSINGSLTDATVDTRSARVNNAVQGNADKESLWNAYYGQRSETLTQLGNTLGQMAEYYGQADQYVGSKKTRRRRKRVEEASGEAFMDAAHETGNAWDNPGAPKRLRDWQGHEAYKGHLGASNYTTTEINAPEGAGLRKW